MKIFITVLFFIYFSLLSRGQEKIPVFISGAEGYKTFRIPAIIILPDGDLLAFCEGRVNGSGDFGDIDIVMKRSRDKGKTWSELQIVAEAGSLQAGNPAPVVDITDPSYPHGRVFMFYNTGNNNEAEVRKGNGLREVWYKTSTDNGHTWSSPVNITAQVHRPKQPVFNPLYNSPEDWRSFANTPGHAMQFRKGKYRGRIFVAANHSAGDPQKQFTDYRAFGYFTDDHGLSFHASEDVTQPGSNESTAAELSDDRLIMNSRNQKGDVRARIVSISSDGGATWDTTYFDKTLIDPVCQGSILSLGEKTLAFSNASDEKRRDYLTLRISTDEGRTWEKNILVDRSPDGTGTDYTAYSDIVRLSAGKVGIIYERDKYKQIVFSVIKWK